MVNKRRFQRASFVRDQGAYDWMVGCAIEYMGETLERAEITDFTYQVFRVLLSVMRIDMNGHV